MTAKKVALIGARGHTGAELIKLIDAHAGLELSLASSRAHAGTPVSDQVDSFTGSLMFCNCGPAELAQQDMDIVVLALPNGLAGGFVTAWDNAKRSGLIIDLGADYRFDETWYYGLPELTRALADGCTRISNPGCYATAMQLALAPIVDLLDTPPVCFGVSGFSGAGTTPSPKNDPAILQDNLLPYSPFGHIHEREVSAQLASPVRFMPHVASHFRGISMTVQATLTQRLDKSHLEERYRDLYANEPLIRLSDEIPLEADNQLRHHACVGGLQLSEDGRNVVVFATLDNLLKGAATQALQNINIACGFAELEGIEHG